MVEVLAAAGVLSVVMLGAAVGADRAVRFNMYSRTASAATTLVHDKVEELEAKPAVDPDMTAGTHNDPGNPLTAGGVDGGSFTRSWTVTNNSPVAGLKTVVVQVTWTLHGANHNIRLAMVRQ